MLVHRWSPTRSELGLITVVELASTSDIFHFEVTDVVPEILGAGRSGLLPETHWLTELEIMVLLFERGYQRVCLLKHLFLTATLFLHVYEIEQKAFQPSPAIGQRRLAQITL